MTANTSPSVSERCPDWSTPETQATVRIDLVDNDDPPVRVFFEHANYEVTSTYQERAPRLLPGWT